jgi:hypothetical protein
MGFIEHTVHRHKISPCLYDAVTLLMPSTELIVAYCARHTAEHCAGRMESLQMLRYVVYILTTVL